MFARYVAIGDSQTEGLNDHDGAGGFIGWADRLARHLAVEHPDVRYANLAVRGRLAAQVRDEQLDPALALEPDLVTIAAGVNDLRRRGSDVEGVVELLDGMYHRLRSSGATVATCTFPDITAMIPMSQRVRPRLDALNAGIREVAARHDVVLVDLADHGPATDPRWWSDDRLHLNTEGHRVLAAAFADALGLPDVEPWQDPLPPTAAIRRWRRAAGDARWVIKYLAPSVARHAVGRSSGDGRSPKRPRLEPLTAPQVGEPR
jgi:lysophospholipase L1-like esterase